MRAALVLLCGICFFGVILNASQMREESANAESSLQGMSSDSKISEFAFEMGKSPLESINMLQYFGVILILVGLLIFLWYVKNRLNSPQIKATKPNVLGALFDAKNSTSAVQVQSITTLGLNSKLIVFEAYQKRYLVILGNSYAKLVDSYSIESESATQESFKELLEQELPSEAK